MKDFLKKWWPTILHGIGVLVIFLNPSVIAWISMHPDKSAGIAAAWGFIMHILQSPVKKA